MVTQIKMTDADVFGKLSRIFETHAFSNDDSQLNEFLEDFDPNNPNFESTGGRSSSGSPSKKKQYVIRSWLIFS